MLSDSDGISNPIDYALPGDGFWPDLNVTDFQTEYPIPAHKGQGILVSRLVMAQFQINRQLDGFKTDQQAAGFASLSDVPQLVLGEVKALDLYYRQAVFAWAMAELHPELVSIMGRDEALDYQDKVGKNQNHYFARSANMQALILGDKAKRRSRAELL